MGSPNLLPLDWKSPLFTSPWPGTMAKTRSTTKKTTGDETAASSQTDPLRPSSTKKIRRVPDSIDLPLDDSHEYSNPDPINAETIANQFPKTRHKLSDFNFRRVLNSKLPLRTCTKRICLFCCHEFYAGLATDPWTCFSWCSQASRAFCWGSEGSGQKRRPSSEERECEACASSRVVL